jgi:hypothetical protein
MATIELVPVLIHFNATPDRVEARIRHYANDHAVLEDSHLFTDPAIMAKVAELAVLLTGSAPVADCQWAGEAVGATLKQDIKLTAAETIKELETAKATLDARIADLKAE